MCLTKIIEIKDRGRKQRKRKGEREGGRGKEKPRQGGVNRVPLWPFIVYSYLM